MAESTTEKPFGYVYKITNRVNGKRYIGATTQGVLARWKQHIDMSKIASKKTSLQMDILEFGVEKFNVEIIDTCYTRESLGESEVKFIEKYNTRYPKVGYNTAPGGKLNPPKSGKRCSVRISDEAYSYLKKYHIDIQLFSRDAIDKEIQRIKAEQQDSTQLKQAS